MLIEHEAAGWSIFPLAALIATPILLIYFLMLRPRLKGRWYLVIPITFPLLPAALIGALVAPIVAYNVGTQVIVLRPGGDSGKYLLYGSKVYTTREGRALRLATAKGREAIVVNDAPEACRIVKVYYGFPRNRDVLDVPSGGMAPYAERIDAVGPPPEYVMAQYTASRVYVVPDSARP